MNHSHSESHEYHPAGHGGSAPTARGQRRSTWAAVAVRTVDWLFYVLYGILGLRFLLTLLGARESAGFTQFVYGLSDPFYGPFERILARPAADGGMVDLPALVAILAYVVLHLAVRGLLRVLATRTKAS